MMEPLDTDDLRDLGREALDRGEGAYSEPFLSWQADTLRAMDRNWLSVVDQAGDVDEVSLEGDGNVFVHGDGGSFIVRVIDDEAMLDPVG